MQTEVAHLLAIYSDREICVRTPVRRISIPMFDKPKSYISARYATTLDAPAS
jgi:hypothetical protein